METETAPYLGVERLEALLDELEAGSGTDSVVGASFDLRPDDTGLPTAIRILRQAVREALPAKAGDDDLGRLVEHLDETLKTASSAGYPGVFLAGTFKEPTRGIAPVTLPPRNRLQIDQHVSRFELARSRALVRQPVAAVWADRSGLRWAMTRGYAAPLRGESESDTHFMQGSMGRTGQHGRGGSVDRPAGGHGKSNVERSAEEERERFAREAAEIIERQLGGAAIILLDGPPEFGARLESALSDSSHRRVENVTLGEQPPTTEALVSAALERGREAQFERAAALARDVTDGGMGDRAVVGDVAVSAALEQGRLDQLMLHEDAVGHFGDAIDARAKGGLADGARVEALLRAALEQAATVWFTRDEPDAPARSQPLGTLRW